MNLELIPIRENPPENHPLLDDPQCRDIIVATTDFYKKVGFTKPWIGYLARLSGQLVGSAGFKGKPRENTIEIAYGAFPAFQNKGIGTAICRKLVEISLSTDPKIVITARTLQDNFASISVLKKNGFELLGIVNDQDDGEVLEWRYAGN